MNVTYTKSQSLLYPYPAGTGVGYMNDSGTLYLICSELFYDPAQAVEQPISSLTMMFGYTLIGFLCLVIVCSTTTWMIRKKSYRRQVDSV